MTSGKPKLAGFVALAYILIIVYASLQPFQGWRAPPEEVLGFLTAPWPRYITAGDVMLNIVAYLPLGAILVTALRPPLAPAAAFIAATLTAIESTDLSQLKKPLALVFTSDEEIGCLGAKRLAEARPFAAQYAIVGEPTSLQPMRAGKGYCLATVTVRGQEAHSAYPTFGASAI